MQARKIVAMLAAAVMTAACGDAATNAVPAGPSFVVSSNITGPNPVTCSGFHTYDSNPSGGSGYTYEWHYQVHGDAVNWWALGTSRTATQWIDFADTTMTFRVKVTSGGQTSTSYKTITGPYNTQQVC